MVDKWPDEPRQVTASNATGHLISGVFPLGENHEIWTFWWDETETTEGNMVNDLRHFCETKDRKEAGLLSMGIMLERMWFSQFLMAFIHSERFPEATVWALSWTASQHRVSLMLHMI